MILGIDLDNTIVCYDQLFWRLACERGWISSSVPCRKECVRDELRRLGREADWTKLQGEVYGPLMTQATPFPGVLTALQHLRNSGWTVHVVSHRSRTPFAGPAHDLHAAAREWLQTHGFLHDSTTSGGSSCVFLETEKAAKLARIQTLRCDWFIDDLPELLTDANFPGGVRRVLFDPHGHRPALPLDIGRFEDWAMVTGLLTGASA